MGCILLIDDAQLRGSRGTMDMLSPISKMKYRNIKIPTTVKGHLLSLCAEGIPHLLSIKVTRISCGDFCYSPWLAVPHMNNLEMGK